MKVNYTNLVIILILTITLCACGAKSGSAYDSENLGNNDSTNLTDDSSENNLTDFPLIKRENSFYDIAVDELTPENYPKIGSTEYTADISKMLFENFFTCAENNSIRSHELYPHNYFTPQELTEKVIRGEIDVAFIEQTDMVSVYDGSLSYTLLGIDALVILTSTDNTVSTISSENLKKVTDGNIVNWENLGGKDGRISLLGSENFNSGNYLFEKCFLNDQGKIKTSITDLQYADMYDERNVISAQFNRSSDYVMEFAPFYKMLASLSFSEGILKDEVKPIYIDGQKPVSQNIVNKDYPYIVKIYAVTKSGIASDSIVQQIIEALTDSEPDSPLFKMLSGAGVIDKPMDLSVYLFLD
jgi:hypothetical protein